MAARHPSSWWPKAADTVGIAITGGIIGAIGTGATAFRVKVPTVVGARGGLIRTQIGEVPRAAGVILNKSQRTLWPATAKAYHGQTEANDPTASHIRPQSPSDNSSMTISPAPPVSRRSGRHIAPSTFR